MKTIDYRMSGLSWDISKAEKVLKPLSAEEMRAANDLILKKEGGLFGVYWCQSENGTTFEEIQVGRPGWAHRGADFYSVKSGGVEIRTKSYSAAIRMFTKKARCA